MQIEENILLAPFTTFSIGGSARYFVRVSTLEELREVLTVAEEKNLSPFILGGGSNILVPDEGLEKFVIKIEIQGIEMQHEKKEEGKEDASAVLVAGAGESWDALVKRSVEENLWGIENLSGIPGTVGGAVAGNIGAYGQALSQRLLWVEVLDTHSGEVIRMTNAECLFGYRQSFFSKNSQHVVVCAAFRLKSDPNPELSYKDLKAIFNDSSTDLRAIREAVLAIREGKFPDLSLEGTAGSFFKNPVLPAAEAHKLQEQYPQMPLYLMPEAPGSVKVPIAWLMDKVLGLHGLKQGSARLYEKQILVIAAQKNGSAREVRELADRVQKEIKQKLGIEIEREVKVL